MTASPDYAEFISRKEHLSGMHGFDPGSLPTFLFDFQVALVTWALRKGRGAILADCGLGKTPMQLVWADQVVRRTNKPVLIVTPLAVSAQTVEEAGKFGIDAVRSKDGAIGQSPRIVVTNYDSLHHFDASQFVGCVCDESSAIKSFDGQRRLIVTEFLRKLPHRLLCTATAAPNDYIELGTSSEALGALGYMDMLGRFFKNDQNSTTANRNWEGAKFRFKHHAEQPFWRWVCSWARACRRPSDLGFDDGRFKLPPLIENQTVVKAARRAPGFLFEIPAVGLREQRDELRRTLTERCEAVAEKVRHDKSAVVWCHLNEEGRLLNKLIGGSVEVHGGQSDDEKEEAFGAFAAGRVRVLVTKPKIGAWGLNWQHCSHMTFFPSHSFEQYYQSVRRCWRFGQQSAVTVDVIATEGQSDVLANLRRKAASADLMFSHLVANMADAMGVEKVLQFTKKEEVPSWLYPSKKSPTATRSGKATAAR